MTSRQLPFRVGMRVEIVARTHPWFGQIGHIVEPFSAAADPRLAWAVEFDGGGGTYPGQRSAVTESEIRSRPYGI